MSHSAAHAADRLSLCVCVCVEGEFGAMMYVSLVNDGPVTLVLDTADKSFERAQAKAARPLSNNAQQQQQQQQQHVHAAPSTAPAAHRVASEDSKAEDP